jgi:hypothetical protein
MIAIQVRGMREARQMFQGIADDLEGDPVVQQVGRATERALLYAQSIAPRATGRYAKSLDRQVIVRGREVRGQIIARAPYAEYVEYDTRPHWPPFEPIYDWVQAKGLGAGKEQRSIAYLVCRAIARRGTRGQHVLERSMERYHAKFHQALGNEVYRIMVRRSKEAARGYVR